KLPGDDLVNIATLGFRGEALPSIAAVGRLSLTSRRRGADGAWKLTVEAGVKGRPEPAALGPGTRGELRDLFFATPARLKFVKAARTGLAPSELALAGGAVKRLAMAMPLVGFTLADETRPLVRLNPPGADLIAGSDPAAARLARLAAILGRDFADNALPILAEREGVQLT